MMLRNIWPAPIIATLFFISSEQENCRRTSVLNQCQFSVAKNRIHQAIRVVHLGTSQSECLIKMERFHWSTGIYCPLSWFCGMGLDSTGDYSWVTSGAVSPVREMCNIWVQSDVINCNDVLISIYDAKILRRMFNKLLSTLVLLFARVAFFNKFFRRIVYHEKFLGLWSLKNPSMRNLRFQPCIDGISIGYKRLPKSPKKLQKCLQMVRIRWGNCQKGRENVRKWVGSSITALNKWVEYCIQ